MSGFDSDDAHIGRVAHLRQGNRYTFHIQKVSMYILIVSAHADRGCGRVGSVLERISKAGEGSGSTPLMDALNFSYCFLVFFGFFVWSRS